MCSLRRAHIVEDSFSMRAVQARMRSGFLPALCLTLSGCVSTVYHVATAPVRVTSWTVDKLTTSQSEADRNRGRRDRKAEARQEREARKAAREQRRAAEQAGQPY